MVDMHISVDQKALLFCLHALHKGCSGQICNNGVVSSENMAKATLGGRREADINIWN